MRKRVSYPYVYYMSRILDNTVTAGKKLMAFIIIAPVWYRISNPGSFPFAPGLSKASRNNASCPRAHPAQTQVPGIRTTTSRSWSARPTVRHHDSGRAWPSFLYPYPPFISSFFVRRKYNIEATSHPLVNYSDSLTSKSPFRLLIFANERKSIRRYFIR